MAKSKLAQENLATISAWLSSDLGHLVFPGDCDPVIGQWFLDDEFFEDWKEGRPWELRIFGPPGAGKTVLLSQISAHLKRQRQRQQDRDGKIAPILTLNFSQGVHHHLTTEHEWSCALLSQLALQLRQDDEVAQDLHHLYRHSNTAVHPPPQATWQCLARVLQSSGRTYLLVDGIDECADDVEEHLQSFLKSLRDQSGSGLSVLLSSRWFDGHSAVPAWCDTCPRGDLKIYWVCGQCPEDPVYCRNCFRKTKACIPGQHDLIEDYAHVTIIITTPKDALTQYVSNKLEKEIQKRTSFGRHLDQNVGLSDRIKTGIQAHAHGNILFATKYFELLLEAPDMLTINTLLESDSLILTDVNNTSVHADDNEAERVMSSLPKALVELYQKWLELILDKQSEANNLLAMGVLTLAAYAKRYLTFPELHHALATSLLAKKFWHNKELLLATVTKDKVIRATKGLIDINKDINEVVEITRPFHPTLHAYLLIVRSQRFANGSAVLASTCLDYLQHGRFPENRFQDFPFLHPLLRYAVLHLGDHYRDACKPVKHGTEELKEQVKMLKDSAWVLLQDASRTEACMQAALCAQDAENADEKQSLFCNNDWYRKSTSLHYCAFLGLTDIIDAHENFFKTQINEAESSLNQTPLMFAAKRGFQQAVRLLLKFHADPNKVDIRGRTAVAEAIDHGHRLVVHEILDYCAQPQRNIEPFAVRTADGKHYTPLMYAVKRGQLKIVDDLRRDKSTKLDARDAEGCTALWMACSHASKSKNVIASKIAMTLLKRTKAVNTADSTFGQTPLHKAAGQDDAQLVKALMGHDADPWTKDKQRGGTAILRAAEEGSLAALESIFEALPSEDRTKLHTLVDDDGRSPLHGACELPIKDGRKNLEILRFLLSRADLDVDAIDFNGSTSLHEACRSGCLDVVRYLLQEAKARPAIKDKQGRTPYSIAWQYRQDEIMKLFQREVEVEAGEDVKDKLSLPLWAAVRWKDNELLKKILDRRPDSLEDREMRFGDSALHWCIMENQPEALRLILNAANCNVNMANANARTALHYAADLCTAELAAMLLQQKEINVDAEDQWGITPLGLACYRPCFEVAFQLIDHGADTGTRNVNVQELLFEAVKRGNVGMAKTLRNRGACVMDRNNEGLTALDLAAQLKESFFPDEIREGMVEVLAYQPSI